jgi:hypothetical protein
MTVQCTVLYTFQLDLNTVRVVDCGKDFAVVIKGLKIMLEDIEEMSLTNYVKHVHCAYTGNKLSMSMSMSVY